MKNLQRKIIENHKMLDMIRVSDNESATVEALRDVLGLSRPAADNMYKKLTGIYYKEMTEKEREKEGFIPDLTEVIPVVENRKIVGDQAYFLGISCGSEHTRLVVCDLTLNPIPITRLETDDKIKAADIIRELKEGSAAAAFEENEGGQTGLAFKTPAQFTDLQKLIGFIVRLFLDLKMSNSEFNLMGIGFAVAGPVNYAEGTWLSAPRLKNIIDVKIADLIGHGNYSALPDDVFLSIDNNSKATIISEYQALFSSKHGKYNRDTAVIYVGSGLGLAMVMDNNLVRGTNNYSGEIGHILFLQEGDGWHSFEERMPEDTTSETFIKYLACMVNMVTCILGIEHIVLTGHSIEKNTTFLQQVQDLRSSFYTSPVTKHSSSVDAGRNDANTAAIGAAIEAYFCMCNYKKTDQVAPPDDPRAQRTNLALDITW